MHVVAVSRVPTRAPPNDESAGQSDAATVATRTAIRTAVHTAISHARRPHAAPVADTPGSCSTVSTPADT